MATIELSVDPKYVRGWGAWEAFREILQNALDGRDRGYGLTISRGGGERKSVRITNEGVVLERKTLLLGGTDKLGDATQRGQFGEGYKLALLVLARQGIEVQIRTGDEMWTPVIEPSATFGADCLKIRIRKCDKYEAKIEVIIHDLSDADWSRFADRVLAVDIESRRPVDALSVGASRILQSEPHVGQLYARGLYVGSLPGGTFRYGYDLADVSLDRDRKMADWWSLRACIRDCLVKALADEKLAPEEIYALLSSDYAESGLIESYYQYSAAGDNLTSALAQVFKARHGAETVPVTNMADAIVAEHHGVSSVVVGKSLFRALEKELPGLEKAKAERGLTAKQSYSLSDLDSEEATNLRWALGLLGQYPVQVVEFVSPHIMGTWSAKDGIRVARGQLRKRADLIETLVHEVAHALTGAGDGTAEHGAAMTRILADLISTRVE